MDEEILNVLYEIKDDLKLIKKQLKIVERSQSPDHDHDQISDQDLDQFKSILIDLDLDPDLYDLEKAKRTIRYYLDHELTIRAPKAYLTKSLAKFMKPVVYHYEGEKQIEEEIEIDFSKYQDISNEELFEKYQSINPETAQTIGSPEKLDLAFVKRIVLRSLVEHGLI